LPIIPVHSRYFKKNRISRVVAFAVLFSLYLCSIEFAKKREILKVELFPFSPKNKFQIPSNCLPTKLYRQQNGTVYIQEQKNLRIFFSRGKNTIYLYFSTQQIENKMFAQNQFLLRPKAKKIKRNV
jgi:hypothetical protein